MLALFSNFCRETKRIAIEEDIVKSIHSIASLLLLLSLTACFGLKTKMEKTNEYIDNPRQSVAWSGVYQGIQPCAACPGVATMLTLGPSGEYTLRTRLLGKEHIDRKSEGQFIWLPNNSHIELQNEQPKQTYRVSKNFIELTLPDGSLIPSSNDNTQYRLEKTN